MVDDIYIYTNDVVGPARMVRFMMDRIVVLTTLLFVVWAPERLNYVFCNRVSLDLFVRVHRVSGQS